MRADGVPKSADWEADDHYLDGAQHVGIYHPPSSKRAVHAILYHEGPTYPNLEYLWFPPGIYTYVGAYGIQMLPTLGSLDPPAFCLRKRNRGSGYTRQAI